MRLLLDTHTLLWALAEPDRLSVRARHAIVDPGTTVAVSVASLWEVAIKHALGRINLSADVIATSAAETGFITLDITSRDAITAGDLPSLHRDPFDRMLVAQAVSQGWTLATRDRALSRYDVAVLTV